MTAIVASLIVASVSLSLAITAFSRGSRNETSHDQSVPPNVLIVVTDDQRGGLNVMPRTRKAFRQEGVRFPNAFATTPVCCPSRASILTGRYAHNHGVKSNRWFGGASNFDPHGTLPRLLRQQGYLTGLVGKYLNTWPLDRAPYDFDEYLMTKGKHYRAGRWNENGRIGRDGRYSTSVMTEAAAEFVRAQRGKKPWFLLVGTIAPHFPFIPEDRYEHADVGEWTRTPAHEGKADRGKPAFIRDQKASFREAEEIRAAQLRTLMSVDDLVGEVFDALEETRQDRDTLAFFISDNGMMWGEYGLLNKGLPYTPGLEVPMMMRWPRRFGGGNVDDRLVANIDITPTIMDAVGLEDLPGFDGRSLLDPRWDRERLLLEYWRNVHRRRPWAAVRTKEWQYTEHYDKDSGSISFRELYDLERDPLQRKNLLWKRDIPARAPLEDLKRALQRDRRCTGTTGPRSCP